MKSSAAGSRFASGAAGGHQSSTSTTGSKTATGRPAGPTGGGSRRITKSNTSVGSVPTSTTNTRKQAVARNFLLHNSVPMHGKQPEAAKREFPKGLGKPDQKEQEKEESPLDVEEILWSRQIARSEIQPVNLAPIRLRDMLEKDLQLKQHAKPKPFLENGITENEVNIRITEGVKQDLLDWFARDFLLISRKWASLSADANAIQMAAQREKIAADLPRHVFEGEGTASSGRAQSIGSSSNGRNEAASLGSTNSTVSRRDRERTPGPELELCESVPEQKLDELREAFRRKARAQLLVNLTKPGPLEEMDTEEDDLALPENCWNGQSRLSVQFTKLALIPSLEPLYASVSLYSLKMRQKLSEDFHFDSGLASAKGATRALFTLPDQEAGDELALVFRLEKGLQRGGLDAALEPYVANKKQQEDRVKIQNEPSIQRASIFRQQIGLVAVPLARTVANAFSGHEAQGKRGGGPPRSFTDSFIQTNLADQADAGNCRQSETLSESSSIDRFSCSAMPMRPPSTWTLQHQKSEESPVQSNNNWIRSLQNQSVAVRVSHFLRSEPMAEGEMFEWLIAMFGNGQQRQSREKIPLDLRFRLEICPLDALSAQQWRIISPERCLLNLHQIVAGFGHQKEEWMELLEGAPMAQDLLPFPVTPRLVMPHTFARHLLFLYPRWVNFSARAGQNARNICVRAELLDGQMQRVEAFVCENGELTASIQSAVQYHCKQPQLSGTEWKLLLPREAPEGLHLRFTFLHVSCRPKEGKGPAQHTETPIGFTWLPLRPTADAELPTGEQSLPIALEPLPAAICFLSPQLQLPNIHWLDSHRPLFHISLQLVSSIQPQDPFLHAFLHSSHIFLQQNQKTTLPSDELLLCIQNLLKTRPEPMLAFLHVLLHCLLTILANSTDQKLSQSCFDTLCQLVKIGTMLLDGRMDKWGRSRFLMDFIRQHSLTMQNDGKQADMNGNLDAKRTTMLGMKEDRRNNNLPMKPLDKKMANGHTQNTVAVKTIFLHEQLCRLFLTAQGTAHDTACSFCWFPLALIRRAMTEQIVHSDGQLLPRKMRFCPEFMTNLAKLGEMLRTECFDRLPKNFAQARAINHAWARFLCQGIALLSRSFLTEELRQHCAQMDARIATLEKANPVLAEQLLSLKMAFMRELYSHEHFIFLCLPFAELPTQSEKSSQKHEETTTSLRRSASILIGARKGIGPRVQANSSKSASALPSKVAQSALFPHPSTEHSRRHFPVSLLLSQLHSLLSTGSSSSSTSACVDLLHWLLAAHENDWRLRDPILRQQVALMYSPLLAIVLGMDGNIENLLIGEKDKADQRSDADSGLASEEEGSNGTTSGRSGKLCQENRTMGQKLLLCICWLLRSLHPPTLLQHLRMLPPNQLTKFVLLLRALVFAFSQSSPLQAKRRNSADSFVQLNLQIGPSNDDFQLLSCPPPVPPGRRQSVETTANEHGSMKAAAQHEEKTPKHSQIRWRKPTEVISLIETKIGRHLSAEVLLLVLDQYDLLLHLAPSIASLPAELHRLLLHILSGHHSLASLEHIFRSQRAFVRKFPEFLLLEGQSNGNDNLSSLCLQLLRHMCSELPEVCAQAGMSTFALLRSSQKLSKGAFLRLSKTFTMALSSLVSNAAASGLTLNDALLRHSLDALLQIRDGTEAKKEATTWRAQLEELVANLGAILVDTMKLTACSDDFEMTVDLMQRIAKGYRNNPELRIAWLMAIARKHLEEGHRNYAEAGQCLLHCCAIVADQLASSGAVDDELLPHTVFQAFEELSENVREEWSQGRAGRAEKKTMENAVHFTVEGFGEMVEKTAKLFERAQLFELIPTLFKLVLPMHERQHAHAKQIQLHAQIVSCLSRMDPPLLLGMDKDDWDWPTAGSPSADKRCFGTYFRVRFFGHRFGELDGQEFVYKEPAITKLAEISHRLVDFYTARFGVGIVEMLKDSGEIDPKLMDSERAYLQVIYVEPHFERWERKKRQTHVQRSYRLKHFLFATPFTQQPGKAHGPLGEQFKRKTVLTVEHSFPHVSTRLRVIKREQCVLSPIEVAIEDVQKRARELGWAMAARPVDAKMLQMVLQGCIGTTVNQGPLEIARLFLSGANLDSEGLPRDGLQRRLRLCFDELGRRCAEALEMNERLMEPGREEYQRELRRNMSHFEQTMAHLNVRHHLANGHFNDGPAPSAAELVQALALAGKIGPISTV